MEKIVKSPETTAEWMAYYDLRYRILRAPWGQALGSEKNEGDLTAIHAACFSEHKIIGVGRLDIYDKQIGQVRFMAVDQNIQKQGIGKLIMFYLEELSKNREDVGMILHAREEAIEFYEKLGYTLIEKSHLLFGEIQHYLMKKDYADGK
jgi:GNAT superfamily N-acetyltransferase